MMLRRKKKGKKPEQAPPGPGQEGAGKLEEIERQMAAKHEAAPHAAAAGPPGGMPPELREEPEHGLMEEVKELRKGPPSKPSPGRTHAILGIIFAIGGLFIPQPLAGLLGLLVLLLSFSAIRKGSRILGIIGFILALAILGHVTLYFGFCGSLQSSLATLCNEIPAQPLLNYLAIGG